MAAPTYDPYLQFNPTFKWGGRSWGANDLDAFKQYLRKRGKNYNVWARRHGTAAKVFDPVEQEMYGVYKPQLDALNYERQKAAAMQSRRMHDLAGFTQAIMGMLGEIGPSVRGQYGEGAETMQAGGTGYGSVLNNAMAANAQPANTLLDVLGAPEGQQLSGGDAGGVLAGLAGWLPAEMLKTQGGAYAEALGQLPKEASFQAQIEMRHLLAEAADIDSDFSNEIKGIISGMGASRQEIKDRKTEQALAQQEYRLKAIAEERDWWLKKQALLLSQGKAKLAAQAEKRAQQAQDRYDWESQGRDSNGNPMPGYTVNPKTGLLVPPGYKVDKNGNVVKVSSANGGGKGGGLTPNAKAEAIHRLDSEETRKRINEAMAKAIAAEFTESPMGPYKNEKIRKRKLAAKIMKQFSYLATFPQARKLLNDIVNAALRSGGGTGGTTGGASTGSSSDAWDWTP